MPLFQKKKEMKQSLIIIVLKKIARDFYKKKLFLNGKKILIAMSGGQDSMSCFFFIFLIKNQFKLEIGSSNCNHLFQTDSFYCSQNNLNQVYAVDGNYSLSLCPYWLSAEIEARNWRHSVLQRTAYFYKFSSIYFGHTETDRLETLLFQLLRGSGIQGVHSIQWKREIKLFSFFLSKLSFFKVKKDKEFLLGNIISFRPLLGITRLETCFICNGWSLPSYSDNSNASLCYTRNRIRMEVLPILRRILNPRLEKTICRFAEIVSEENFYLNNILDNIKTWVDPSTDLLFVSQVQMESITVKLERVWHAKKIEDGRVELEPLNRCFFFEKKWLQSLKPLFLKPNFELFRTNNKSNCIISFSKTCVLRQAPLALKRRFLKMKLEDFQVKEVNFHKVERFRNALFNKSKKKKINTDLDVEKDWGLAFSGFYKLKKRKNIFISILFIPKVGAFFFLKERKTGHLNLQTCGPF